MKNKSLKHFYRGILIIYCSFAMFMAPAATLQTQAATPPDTTISPQADVKYYVFKDENGARWKRLWNSTKRVYEGDWIFVCYL